MKDQDFITLNRRNSWLWFLLAFQAGAVNAGGFVAAGRFVTHTTGFATHFAYDLASWKLTHALSMLTVPVFFLFGAMVSAYFVAPQREDKNPNYRWPAFFIFLCLALAMILGELGLFGIYGEDDRARKDYLFMVLLCMASGLQNALISNANGMVVRTTHLTGVTTDLATGVMRLLHLHKEDRHRRHELLANFARLGIIVSFVVGSSVSALLFLRAEYWGFLLPVFTSLVMLQYFIRRT
jgi:uncharacterized membrane protein YoaK (UPF0700 family)